LEVTLISLASTPLQVLFCIYDNNVEFMFTKNFNSKVNCSFQKDVGSLILQIQLPLTNSWFFLLAMSLIYSEPMLVNYAKKFYEQKGTFLMSAFCIYDQIQRSTLKSMHGEAKTLIWVLKQRNLLHCIQKS
jgi:hypothetical protein